MINTREFFEGKKRAAEIAEEKGFRGFTVIAHPWWATASAESATENRTRFMPHSRRTSCTPTSNNIANLIVVSLS
ncbi:hypothetical protein AArcCO_4097 (plasmid) [Halalkaliarchaeum sp. AArc-CO]|nr:hypothetical protein AArcCO_4097 [Halalkaliarchaeum sp. AArc-CO]